MILVDGAGLGFALAFSILYPLCVCVLLWRWRFGWEPLKPLAVAFIVGLVMFYVAYLRKVYVLFLSGVGLYAVDLVATGFVEEAAKLLVLFIPVVKRRVSVETGLFYGMVAGLGFGAGEALIVLADAALAVPVLVNIWLLLYWLEVSGALVSLPELIWLIDFTLLYLAFNLALSLSVPSVFGVSLLGVYERSIVVLLHGALTGIVGWSVARNATVKFYLLAVGLHILVDFFAVLYMLGLANVTVVEVILTAITVPLFLYLLWKSTPTQGDALTPLA
ncbi:MAG: hypothetical protein ACTSUS_00190 [Candidatus Freyarchaeota archaeon]